MSAGFYSALQHSSATALKVIQGEGGENGTEEQPELLKLKQLKGRLNAIQTSRSKMCLKMKFLFRWSLIQIFFMLCAFIYMCVVSNMNTPVPENVS